MKNTFEDRVTLIASDLHDTLIKKNADYGDSHAKLTEELGETVILIRLKDKLNRLTHLIQSGSPAQVNESIEDTLLDLAGYSVLELERRRRDGNKQVGPVECGYCEAELGEIGVAGTEGGTFCSNKCATLNDARIRDQRRMQSR